MEEKRSLATNKDSAETNKTKIFEKGVSQANTFYHLKILPLKPKPSTSTHERKLAPHTYPAVTNQNNLTRTIHHMKSKNHTIKHQDRSKKYNQGYLADFLMVRSF